MFAFYMYTRHNSVISIVKVKCRWHSMALSSISQISWSLEVKSRCWSIFRWNISEIVKFIKIQIIVIACHYGKMIDGNCYHQNLIIIMLLIVKTLCFSIHASFVNFSASGLLNRFIFIVDRNAVWTMYYMIMYYIRIWGIKVFVLITGFNSSQFLKIEL